MTRMIIVIHLTLKTLLEGKSLMEFTVYNRSFNAIQNCVCESKLVVGIMVVN